MSEDDHIVIDGQCAKLVPTAEFRWLQLTEPHWSGKLVEPARLQQKWTARGLVTSEHRWRDVPVVTVAKDKLEAQ
jgi:hypothetical protein